MGKEDALILLTKNYSGALEAENMRQRLAMFLRARKLHNIMKV